MEKIHTDEVDNSVQPAVVMHHLTELLSVIDLTINYYELEPSDRFAFAYHNHEVQEELFSVQSGDGDVRRLRAGPVTVDKDETIRFDREEFLRG